MLSTQHLTQPNLIQNNTISDTQILVYIWSVVKRFRERGQENSLECILSQEKLIHLSLLLGEKHIGVKEQGLFELGAEIGKFIQKINKLAMQNLKEEEQGSSKFIGKAVDVVMIPTVSRYFADEVTLSKLKILTFNNLACILKKNRRFMMALKAVSFAIDLEQRLIALSQQEEKYDIVPTYLNKAAILSEMKKHQKALQQIRKARAYVQKIQREVQCKLKQCKQQGESIRLKEKKHYGLYMKMLIHYNIGVQKQHQKLISSAISYYQQGRKLAIMVDNQLMAKKLEGIISNLKKNM